MAHASHEVVRSLVNQMILSESQLLSEARDVDVDLSVLFGLPSEDRQNRDFRVKQAGDLAARMIVGQVTLEAGMQKELPRVMGALSRLDNFSDITRSSERGDLVLMSSGEIFAGTLGSAAGDVTQAASDFMDMMMDKLSAVNIILLALTQRIEEAMRERRELESDASVREREAAKGSTAEEIERSVKLARRRAVRQAESEAAEFSEAANRAIADTSRILNSIRTQKKALLAQAGAVLGSDGKLKKFDPQREQEELRSRLQRAGRPAGEVARAIRDDLRNRLTRVGFTSQEIGAYFILQDRRARLGESETVARSVVSVFNSLLATMGLSVARGDAGHGVAKYDVEAGRIDRRMGVEATADAMSAIKMFRSVEDIIAAEEGRTARSRAISPARAAALMDKETRVIIRRGEKVAREVGLDPTTMRSQELRALADRVKREEEDRAAAAGVTATGGASRAEAGSVEVIKRLKEPLQRAAEAMISNEAARNASDSALRGRRFPEAAYRAFVVPIAAALSDGFCGLRSLQDLSAFSPGAVSSAAASRSSAASLASEASEARGFLESVLRKSTAEKFVAGMTGREAESETFQELWAGSPDKPAPAIGLEDVATALRRMRETTGADSQSQILGKSLAVLVTQLSEVVAAAHDEMEDVIQQSGGRVKPPNHLGSIMDTFSAIGPGMGQLIAELSSVAQEKGGSLEDIQGKAFSYIVGTPLEPIRESDVATVEAQARAVGQAGSSAAVEVAPPERRAAAAERSAATAGAESLRRAMEVERPPAGITGPQRLRPADVQRGGLFDLDDDDILSEAKALATLRRALERRAGRSLTEASSVLDPLGAKEFASTPIGALGLTKTGRQVKTKYGETFEEDGGEYNLAVFVNDTLRPLVKSLRAEKQPNQALIDAYDSLGSFISEAAKDDTGANSKQLLSAAQSAAAKWMAISKEIDAADTSADSLIGKVPRSEADLEDLEKAHPLAKFELSRSNMTRGKFKRDFDQVREFYKRAAERLKAGKPVFDFAQYSKKSDSTATTQDQVSPTMDEGWKKYTAADPDKRTPVWNAWVARQRVIAGTPNDVDLAFSSFVMWWKSNSSARRFSDGSKGGYAATIDLLNREAQASKMSAPKQQTAQRQANA
jgi:hypothetical protein